MRRRLGRWPGAPDRRSGVTVLETLVALLLLLGLLGATAAVVGAQRRAASRGVEDAEGIAAERLVRTLLVEETDAGLVGRDWWLGDDGVLHLRAFRTLGLVCPGWAVGPDLVVSVGGIRVPEPEKDSVAALTVEGRWVHAALVSREPFADPCPADPDRPVERWRLDPAVPDAVLVRGYERGSYHLEGGVLRYRRGAGGRQPLTTASLDAGSSGFEVDAAGAVRVEVRRRGAVGTWTRRLGGGPP